MRSLICGTVVVLAAACVVVAAPEPAVVQRADEWTLEVKFEQPRQMIVQLRPNTPPLTFWYTILSITNNTGQEVGFHHKCELMTDTFELIPAGRNVPLTVYQRIKRRHESIYPFLESLDRTDSRILQGEDNAKDIAVIWPDFDSQAGAVTLFITGLSNETAVIDHPIVKDGSGNPVKVYLRKTLELSYTLKGDPSLRSGSDLVFKGKRWVMR